MVRQRFIDLQNGSLKKMAFVFCLTNAIFLSVCGVRMLLSRGGNEEGLVGKGLFRRARYIRNIFMES